MGSNGLKQPSLKGEAGALTVKAVLIVAFLLVAAVLAIKLIPVYVEQQEIAHDTDDLARKAALGTAAYSKDKIEKEIAYLITNYQLPEGSIQLSNLEGNHSEINVKYTRNVDLFITSYAWEYTHTATETIH